MNNAILRSLNTNENIIFSTPVFLLSIAIIISKVGMHVPVLHYFFKYSDELMVVVFLLVFLYCIAVLYKVKKANLILFGIMLLLIVISYFSPYYSGFSNTFIQSVIYVKLLFFFYLYAVVLNKNYFDKLISFLFWFTFLGFLLNIVLGDLFFDIFDIRGRDRGLFVRVAGFQLSPNGLALAAATTFLYALYNKSGRTRYLWLISSTVFIFFSGSRTFIVIQLLLMISYFIDMGLEVKKILNMLISLTLLSIVFIALQSNMLDLTLSQIDRLEDANDSGYMRAVMLFNGFKIALDNFPFGSGLSSFGTPLSSDSEVYYDYGMTVVRGVRDFVSGELGSTGLYDSNISSLMGELGFAGMFVYLLLSYVYLIAIYKLYGANKMTAFFVFWLVILVASITKPVFFESYFVLLFAIILAIPLKSKTYNKPLYQNSVH